MSAIMPTYGSPSLAFERGDGVYLYDTDGKQYLDFCTGIAVTALGHNHPHLVHAIQDQAGKLLHYSNLYRDSRPRAYGSTPSGQHLRKLRLFVTLALSLLSAA